MRARTLRGSSEVETAGPLADMCVDMFSHEFDVLRGQAISVSHHGFEQAAAPVHLVVAEPRLVVCDFVPDQFADISRFMFYSGIFAVDIDLGRALLSGKCAAQGVAFVAHIEVLSHAGHAFIGDDVDHDVFRAECGFRHGGVDADLVALFDRLLHKADQFFA